VHRPCRGKTVILVAGMAWWIGSAGLYPASKTSNAPAHSLPGASRSSGLGQFSRWAAGRGAADTGHAKRQQICGDPARSRPLRTCARTDGPCSGWVRLVREDPPSGGPQQQPLQGGLTIMLKEALGRSRLRWTRRWPRRKGKPCRPRTQDAQSRCGLPASSATWVSAARTRSRANHLGRAGKQTNSSQSPGMGPGCVRSPPGFR
jgi:hypothetical protein